MLKVGFLVRLEAKPGKEAELQKLLEDALALARAEEQTPVWFAFKLGTSTFGIFDAFADETGRQIHLEGRIAQLLMARAPELLAQPPVIEKTDVLAEKLPAA